MFGFKIRKIKYSLLVWYNLAYRLFVVLNHFVFTYLVIKSFDLESLKSTVTYVIAWNIINTMLHYGFDIAFFKFFKIGKDFE